MKNNTYNPLQPAPVPPLQAVIFDLDGVFIDTEWIAFEAWRDVVAQNGSVLGEEHFAPTVGLDMRETARYILAVTDLTVDLDAFIDAQWEIMAAAMRAELNLLPGAANLVAWLRARGIPLAIASNSPVPYIEWVLSLVGLSGSFNAIIGRNLVANSKPAPDVYLAAAHALNAAPSACLAVEDSPVGLQAALSAGMVTAAVPQAHANPRDSIFTAATARFASLVEVQHWLEHGLPALDWKPAPVQPPVINPAP